MSKSITSTDEEIGESTQHISSQKKVNGHNQKPQSTINKNKSKKLIRKNNNLIKKLKETTEILNQFTEKHDSLSLINDELVNENKNLLEKYENCCHQNKKMKQQIQNMKNALETIIPLEYQCCICFNFTYKRIVLAPCGHTQYCEKCIAEINTCSLCNSTIKSKVKIYI